jgi:peptidoglycan/xylan/chitin deacetylase (PgdA/CDA1 family)
MFPNNKLKALTLSYDDGVEQDRKLLEILNRYGIKATFNLNSGIQSGAGAWNRNGVDIRRMNVSGLPELYAGHEIAVHSLTHPHLENLDAETVRNELSLDKANLERLFNAPVYGLAWPFGTYNDETIRIAGECGLRYARGIVSTCFFNAPAADRERMNFQPTCHHDDPKLFDLAEEFILLKPDKPSIFYLWGHSYEFDVNNNWDRIEEFCRLVSGHGDIFYAVNREVLL